MLDKSTRSQLRNTIGCCKRCVPAEQHRGHARCRLALWISYRAGVTRFQRTSRDACCFQTLQLSLHVLCCSSRLSWGCGCLAVASLAKPRSLRYWRSRQIARYVGHFPRQVALQIHDLVPLQKATRVAMACAGAHLLGRLQIRCRNLSQPHNLILLRCCTLCRKSLPQRQPLTLQQTQQMQQRTLRRDILAGSAPWLTTWRLYSITCRQVQASTINTALHQSSIASDVCTRLHHLATLRSAPRLTAISSSITALDTQVCLP